jgi:hypothetical protein
MKVAQELFERTNAFVEGRVALPELYFWLAGNVQAISDANDPQVTELSDELWAVIGEWTDSLRDEASARADVADFLTQRGRHAAGPVATPSQ